MLLNQLSKKIHANAVLKGFYDEKREMGTLLMLIVSELAEAMEADRRDHSKCDMIEYESKMFRASESDFKHLFEENIKDSIEDELADAVIRILDLCGFLQIDIDKHIELKMKYNALCEKKHGGKKY